MGKRKFPRSIHFNLDNVNDAKILEHVKRRNFSGYVKKLILEEIEKKEQEKAPKVPMEGPEKKRSETPTKKETSAERLERLKRSRGVIQKPFIPKS